MTPRAPTLLAPSGASRSTRGSAWGALVRVGHFEHPGGFDVDDLRGAVAAAHHRGHDLDALLPFADHATGFQPGVEAAHVAGVQVLRQDALLILGRVDSEGVWRGNRARGGDRSGFVRPIRPRRNSYRPTRRGCRTSRKRARRGRWCQRRHCACLRRPLEAIGPLRSKEPPKPTAAGPRVPDHAVRYGFGSVPQSGMQSPPQQASAQAQPASHSPLLWHSPDPQLRNQLTKHLDGPSHEG